MTFLSPGLPSGPTVGPGCTVYPAVCIRRMVVYPGVYRRAYTRVVYTRVPRWVGR